MRVAIAGATGFIGRALRGALEDAAHEIIALSRSASDRPGGARTVWRSVNLFNLLHTERALAGAEVAFYLVHAMHPSARLTQGRFDDLDLICADNFARAARAVGVRHIIYLGGIIPQGTEALSDHLRSRLEVEQTLAAHGVPVTALRAALVV
ncbi:MAG TPA: NAD(P)H-binding protein, partial [Myxococcota bacterium]|nr:NAD(P)H-binding protein [Myxococcota bacterium]